ncbi:magnesium transporter MgtE N-terminal domain-containing protein [Actinoplanes sp. HUAS TT8]|uniref:magnesium transporter MgtE N-terminal domain-containing protein n=1 Tax=Actinoplanes sp. HUAS TT8 TaxID=3447453 RepID=UPI003F5209A6
MLSSDVERPDPRSVKNIVDLGRQLALLRLTAARRSPADEPLTLRELSEITGVPRSTLGNAESGRVLPRANVVYRFAQGCGVPADKLPLWTQTRNRLAHDERHRRREARHATVGAVVERLARRVDRDPLQAALDQLRIHELPATKTDLDRVLDALPAERCAAYLTQMTTEAAVECLHVMSVRRAGECFRYLTPQTAAALLEGEEPAMAAEHLLLLGPTLLQQILPLMPISVIVQRLARMARHDAEILVSKMPVPWTSALVADGAVPILLAADLIFQLGLDRSVELLGTMPVFRAAALLAAMNADGAAGLMNQLPLNRTAATMRVMPVVKASRVLAHLPDTKAATLLSSLSTEDVVSLLMEMPPQAAGGVLARLPAAAAVEIVDAVPGEAVEPIKKALLASWGWGIREDWGGYVNSLRVVQDGGDDGAH